MEIKITIKERKEIRCPDCGKLVATSDVRSESSCGSEWKKLLESFGYYGPRKERYENEDYDWYAKDIELTDGQTELLARFVANDKNNVYRRDEVETVVAKALLHGNKVIINVDW